MSKVNYINNGDAAELSRIAKESIEALVKHFECKPDVQFFESIHGHVANITRYNTGGLKEMEDKPLALDLYDIEMLTNISNLRYINISHSEVEYSFHN